MKVIVKIFFQISTLLLCSLFLVPNVLAADVEVCSSAHLHEMEVELLSESSAKTLGQTMSGEFKALELGLAELVNYESKVETIWNSGPSDNRLDIVFLGDGYTKSELTAYSQHVEEAMQAMFAEEPFKSFKNHINIHRVDVVSPESGIDNDPVRGVYRDTALGAKLWCFGVARSLCVDLERTKKYAANFPDYDQIIVVANSEAYGGAGYTHSGVATFTGANKSAHELLLHEFGHSFAKLADEYDGQGTADRYTGSEPKGENVSTLSEEEMRARETKWSQWLGTNPGEHLGGLVGTFEGGNNYSVGVYRPTENSKMRSLGKPFNAPSMEALVVELFGSVSPIDAAYPKKLSVTSDNTLFLDLVVSTGSELKVNWYLDGEMINAEHDVVLEPSKFLTQPGSYKVEVEVIENTSFVRDDEAKASLLRDSHSWTVIVPDLPLRNLEIGELHSKCSFPNGFLGQINVASIVNDGSRELSGRATYRNSTGQILGAREVVLDVNQKLDLSVHDMGLLPDSVGIFCFESTTSDWSGGLSIYAPDLQGGFQFALNYPFTEAETATSVVPLNTFALVSGEPAALNWLRVTDGEVGDGLGLSGVVKYYDAQGVFLAEDRVELADGGRVDLAAHSYLADSSIGLAEFVPAAASQSFYFEVTRYFPSSHGGFHTAMPLQQSKATKSVMRSIYFKDHEHINVVELVNPLLEPTSVLVHVRNALGETLRSDIKLLPGKSSFHYIVDGQDIALDEAGSVLVVGADRVAARMLSYNYGVSSAVAGASSKNMSEPVSDVALAQFNSFINQENVLRLVNTSVEPANIIYSVYDYLNNKLHEQSLEIPGFASEYIELEVPDNIYGSIRVESSKVLSIDSLVEVQGSYHMVLPAN